MWHLLYQKENEILSLSLWFLVQSTVEAVQFLYQIGFPCLKYKGVLALYFFQCFKLEGTFKFETLWPRLVKYSPDGSVTTSLLG